MNRDDAKKLCEQLGIEWNKKAAAPKIKGGRLKSVTRFLFIATQIAALAWVSVSYLIAIYATVRLSQPFPIVELSQQAISTILGVNVLKVVENIFEHNNGGLFGCTKESEDTYGT